MQRSVMPASGPPPKGARHVHVSVVVVHTAISVVQAVPFPASGSVHAATVVASVSPVVAAASVVPVVVAVVVAVVVVPVVVVPVVVALVAPVVVVLPSVPASSTAVVELPPQFTRNS
jgi:hypothetical protein